MARATHWLLATLAITLAVLIVPSLKTREIVGVGVLAIVLGTIIYVARGSK